MSLYRTCLVEKIAVRGQKVRFARANTFFELCMPNYVGTQLEVLTIKIYIYIIYNIDFMDYIYVDCTMYIFTLKASISTTISKMYTIHSFIYLHSMINIGNILKVNTRAEYSAYIGASQ